MGNLTGRFVEEEVKKLFANIKDKNKRNLLILKAYKQGYSQHLIAKVLGITQQAVFGIIKREGKSELLLSPDPYFLEYGKN